MARVQVVTIGGATRDIIFVSRQGTVVRNPKDLTRQKLLAFESGAKILSEEAFFTTGGGGNNTAVTIARLGLPVAANVRIGVDNKGDEVYASLKAQRVRPSLVVRDRTDSTGFSFILASAKEREHIVFMYRGVNNRLTVNAVAIRRVRPQWLYLTSLTGQTWKENMKKTLRLVRSGTTKLFWNPGVTQLAIGYGGLAPLLKQTEAFSVNTDEAIELVLKRHGKISGITNPAVLAKRLQSWGPRLVIITAGRGGVYAYDGSKSYHLPIRPAKVVDTTGAGDCFGASFVAGQILFPGDITRSLRLGIVNTSFLVQQLGAKRGLLTRRQALRYL